MGLFIFLFRYKYYLIYNNTKQANFMFLPHELSRQTHARPMQGQLL